MKSGCESKEMRKGRSVSLPVIPNEPAQNSGIRHSRTSKWRAASLIAVYLLMAGHFIHWRIIGTTVTPIEPSEARFTIETGAVNAGFIFFAVAILATLILGRFICGWICHIVALQDFSSWTLKKLGLTPKPFRSRLLVYVPLVVAFYMFVWPTIVRAITKPNNETMISGFTNHLTTSEFWITFPPVWVAIPFLFICGFLAVYFLGSKGFCTYGCPYGAVFGIADKAAPGRILVTDACNQCGHCTATCTSNVLVHAEVKQFGMVVDPGCMKCMDCVSVCPNDALYFGFAKPLAGKGKGIKKTYSLTWPEEVAAAIICALSYFAAWGVYQAVPMLMAVGIAIVSTFLAIKLWRIFNSSEQTFYRFSLKRSGKITSAGWLFVVFALGWLGLNFHSGWIRYHERRGTAAFLYLQIPDELALAQRNPDQWLSVAERENIAAGKRHFNVTEKYGLLDNADDLSKLAWFKYLSGDSESAVTKLEEAANLQKGDARALSLYYRGAILNRMQKSEDALKSLDEAIDERPNLATAREEKGEALWHLGRRQEAAAVWNEAISANPNLPLANSFLAGAAKTRGEEDAAAEFEERANSVTVDDPYFHWMLGLRLQNVGMSELAEKHFSRAIQLDPKFRMRSTIDALTMPTAK